MSVGALVDPCSRSFGALLNRASLLPQPGSLFGIGPVGRGFIERRVLPDVRNSSSSDPTGGAIGLSTPVPMPSARGGTFSRITSMPMMASAGPSS
jgi:hypothetical protein